MTKPMNLDGYDATVTGNCERVLVTLLRGLGPWQDSIFLVGGLAPRYLIESRPPDVPAHAGTGDVDVVVRLELLAETEAYRSLEENLKKLGFTRGSNDKGTKVAWRWEASVPPAGKVILEFLADDPEKSGGRVVELPTEGNVSAMNIPHASIVFDHHEQRNIRAELLDDGGVGIVTLRYADIVAFTVLKALAFAHRSEGKDAHDLVYCLEHYPGGPAAVADRLRAGWEGRHGETIQEALSNLARDFTDDGETEGYQKVGPKKLARFELGDDREQQDSRVRRQRDAADVISRLLAALGQA